MDENDLAYLFVGKLDKHNSKSSGNTPVPTV